MKILIHWVINALVILMAAYLLPGVVVEGFVPALLVAVVLGILNAVVRPIFIILTFPITIVTFGLFLLVINSFLIYITSLLIRDFSIDTFWWALLFGIVFSVFNFAVSKLFNRPINPVHSHQ